MTVAPHVMRYLAVTVDETLNGPGKPQKYGFAVMAWELNDGLTNEVRYMSNTDKRTLAKTLEDFAKHLRKELKRERH